MSTKVERDENGNEVRYREAMPVDTKGMTEEQRLGEAEKQIALGVKPEDAAKAAGVDPSLVGKEGSVARVQTAQETGKTEAEQAAETGSPRPETKRNQVKKTSTKK